MLQLGAVEHWDYGEVVAQSKVLAALRECQVRVAHDSPRLLCRFLERKAALSPLLHSHVRSTPLARTRSAESRSICLAYVAWRALQNLGSLSDFKAADLELLSSSFQVQRVEARNALRSMRGLHRPSVFGA